MPMEIWKPVSANGYEVYEVSNLGRCRNTRTGRILKLDTLSNGYLRYTLSVDGVIKRISAYRMVALTFVPNHENKKYVNHIDGDKANNSADNLEWVSQSENQLHAVDTGLQVVGSKTSYAKLDEFLVSIIRLRSSMGQSNAEIARKYNVTASLISQIKLYKWWKHVDDSIIEDIVTMLEEMVEVYLEDQSTPKMKGCNS